MEPVMSYHLASTAVATVLEWLAAYGESHWSRGFPRSPQPVVQASSRYWVWSRAIAATHAVRHAAPRISC